VTGDWRLPDWTHLSGAARALVTLLDKAGSPDGLLLQLDEGIKRLKRLQRADSTAEAVSDFEEGYTWLQVR
jgi:hypothetical protein